MYTMLESFNNVELQFSCKFEQFLFDNGKIIGVIANKSGEKKSYKAKLIIDASGTTAALRTVLPENYGVETFKLGPNDVMYVLLQYIRWLHPNNPHPEKDTSYIYWMVWLGPSNNDDEVILGVGQPGSYENAKMARNDFLDRIKLPPYEILKEEKGITPYRRPPYSLVGDNFLCIGDAATITYPFSGHGVTATWILCLIAAEVIEKIFKENKNFTKENLWKINERYFKDQGAKFAGLLVQLFGILNFSEKEWNYFLKKGLIYKTSKKGALPEPNKEYEQSMTFGEMLKFLLKIILGLIIRKLSLKNMKKLLYSNNLANEIKNHYENYPSTPDEFTEWVSKAEDLWQKKLKATKYLRNGFIEYY